MNNTISIWTWLVYKFFDNQNSRIKRLKDFDHEWIELCIADSEALLNLELEQENVDYLKSLEYVSIHLPWINIRYWDNERCRKVLSAVEKLYKKIWAKNVNVHDTEIDDYRIFQEFDFNVLIENDDYKFPDTATPSRINEILWLNQNFRFNLDFAHALTLWGEITKEFIDNFRQKISQIHMSNLTKDIKDHNFLHRDATAETLDLLRYLKENLSDDIPLVLECVASNENEIDLISKEIEFLRNF